VVALNRAVALANVFGAEAGIEAVAKIHNRTKLESYYLLYAVLGEFETRLNHHRIATGHFQKAHELAGTGSERKFLARKLKSARQHSDTHG
jgi:RNA polymerase sigma-70 factor (ECF subfamily)